MSLSHEVGIFPTRIVLENRKIDGDAWPRNVDAVMFRLPARKKDSPQEINDDVLAQRIHDSLNKSGWCVMFAYGSIENKLRPFDFALKMRAKGLVCVDVITLTKPWWGGKRSDTHLACSHEYVFLFTKADRWYLDRACVFPILAGDKDEASCPGNSWRLANYNPAEVYPRDVAATVLKMLSLLPGSVVLDPLMGGSAGLESAVACGYSFIGYEADEKVFKKYEKVVNKLKGSIKERDEEHKL